MPRSPTARLHVNLKACCCCCCCFPLNFPYAWQILNQKRLGNSTLRSCQQSTCEVNLIDGKRKRKPGGRGREAKSMNERLRKCPWSSTIISTTCVSGVASLFDLLVCENSLPLGCLYRHTWTDTSLAFIYVYKCVGVCLHRSAAAWMEIIYMIMAKRQHFSTVCVGEMNISFARGIFKGK